MEDHRVRDLRTIGYIYLASPYSHKDKEMLQLRYEQVRSAVAFLFHLEVAVFSPIVHCHDLTKQCDLPKDAKFWEFYTEAMLQGARELWLLLLDGWKESKGMQGERDIAIEIGIPYRQVKPGVEDLRELAQRVHELHRAQRSS